MKKNIFRALVFCISFMTLIGCSITSAQEEQLTEVEIPRDQAEQLNIDIEVGYGHVDISGGSDLFASGNVTYNHDKLKPNIEYKLSGDTGNIHMHQKKTKVKMKKGALTNNWDVVLANDIPVDLSVNTGASDTALNLTGMDLQALDIEAGVGRTVVDLSGEWKESFDVDLELGVGEFTMILPKEVGVKIKSDKGLVSSNFKGFISQGDGVYVNDAYEHADVIISVSTEIGLGEANFELAD